MHRCLWPLKANLCVLAPAPQGVNAILPLVLRERRGGAGGLNVPTEPLQLGDRAAGLPAEGEVHKLRAKRECHSACALTPLALISSGRAAQIPWRELQWT